MKRKPIYTCLLVLTLTGALAFSQENLFRNCDVCSEFEKSHIEIPKSLIAIWYNDLSQRDKYDVDMAIQVMDMYDERDIPKWRDVVDEYHAQGKLCYAPLRPLTHIGKTFEYVMSDPGLQEALCKDVSLNSMIIPWMKGRGYKDVPVRMYCGNNPRFQAYLRHQVYLISETGIDGIMVDDFTGTPLAFNNGGCFCEYCMAGFREFLKEKYTTAELADLGIDDIESYDYRQVVLRYADDLASLQLARKEGEVPLDHDFRDFLYKSDADLFASLKSMACRLSGRYIEMGWDNVNFAWTRAMYYDYQDCYYTECGHVSLGLGKFGNLQREYSWEQDTDQQLHPEMLWTYKFADETGKWFAPTPSPPSWSAFKIKKMEHLLASWVAFSYANGANFRYPRIGWCFGETSRWFYPDKEVYEPVYSLVRENRGLFDHYEAMEQVGVLFTQKGLAKGGRAIKYACGQLADMNIPFGMPVAGDDWLVNRISVEDIDRFDLMLVPEPTLLDPEQQRILEEWGKKKELIHVNEGDDLKTPLEDAIEPLLSLETDHPVWLFPRHIPGDRKAPLVCHLINQEFQARQDQFVLQEDLKVRLGNDILEGGRVKAVNYFTPGNKPVALDFRAEGDNTYIEVPELDIWGVLKIEK